MMNQQPMLYTYWRSSAAYRVRIALNLKGIAYADRPVSLIADGGQQHHQDYQVINPQELVPTWVDDQLTLTQSLAILEYLDETYSAPALLPSHPQDRAWVRSLAQVVACDIHPLNNLRVLKYLGEEMGQDKASRDQWYLHWVREGFVALEALLQSSNHTGTFCFGDTPTLADIALVPQIYNARRFKLDLTSFPTLVSIDAACQQLEAFRQAAPEQQADAVLS